MAKPVLYKNCGYYIGTHAKDEITPGVIVTRFHGYDMLTITKKVDGKDMPIAIYSPGTNWIVEFV